MSAAAATTEPGNETQVEPVGRYETVQGAVAVIKSRFNNKEKKEDD